MEIRRIPDLATGLGDPRTNARLYSLIGTGLLFCIVLAGSYIILPRLGIQRFTFALIGTVFGLIYLVISFKTLAVPFYLTIFAIGGLRFIWSIQAPFLPDLYLDRIMLLWLLLVFMVKFFAEGKWPKGPYGLDWLLLAHGLYLLARIWAYGFVAFNPWTRSVLVPYLIYFFAKNIIDTKEKIRGLYIALLILGLYYAITSVAEKFNINSLLYPTYMRYAVTEYIGRSNGPFLNPGIFGNTMGMILPINLYFINTIKSRIMKVLLMLNMMLSFVGLYFTYTRGAWMCSLAGLAVVVLLNRKYYLRTLLPVGLLVMIVGLGVLGTGRDTFMKQRVENEDTIGARLGTAVTALRVWKDNPFLGCGSFRYPVVRENYVEPVNIPGFKTIRFVQFRKNAIHDMYLGPLAEDGLVGVGMMFGIYFMILRVYVRKFRWRKHGDHFAVFIIPLFTGVLVSYLVGGFTQSFRHATIMGTMLMMTAGIANGYTPEETRPEDVVSD